MEIPATGDKLLNLTLQNVQKLQQDQLQLIARLAGLKTDNLVQAMISDISDLSSDDRKLLTEQLDKTLAQLKSLQLTPAIQQQIDALEKQKTMLQLDATKLLQLTVNNKSFLVYSNQPLQVGQNILVKLIPNQGLELVNPAPTASADEQIDAIITQNLRQLLPLQKPDNFFTSLATAQQLMELIPNEQKQQLIDKPLQSSLDKLNQIIPTLAKVIDPASLKLILEQSGIQFERKLIESLTRTLPATPASLPNNSTNPQQPADNSAQKPAAVSVNAETLESGQKLSPKDLSPLLTAAKIQPAELAARQLIQAVENKLQGSLPVNPTRDNANTAINSTANSPTNAATAHITNPVTAATNILTSKTNAANLQSLSADGKTISPDNKNNSVDNSNSKRDIKGALVELVAETQRSLQQQGADAENLLKPLQHTHLQDFIAQLLPLLLGGKAAKDLPLKTLRAQLTALLQQHAYQAVAKIQIQQLQTIQPASTQTTQDANPQSWQMEIPIRYQQDIMPLQLHIEKRLVQDQESGEKKNRQKIKQWRVMLNFDLPIVGQFYAQLILLEQTLSATLWAEKMETLQTAKEKMENLRTKLQQEGIIVTQLECLPGSPNKPQNQVNYSLIDITT